MKTNLVCTCHGKSQTAVNEYCPIHNPKGRLEFHPNECDHKTYNPDCPECTGAYDDGGNE